MPRFHFTLGDGATYSDPDGEELRDFEAARLVATRYLTEMLSSRSEELWREGKLSVVVTDQFGSEVARISVVASTSQ